MTGSDDISQVPSLVGVCSFTVPIKKQFQLKLRGYNKMYQVGNVKIHLLQLDLADFFSTYHQHKPYLDKFEQEFNTSLLEVIEHCERPTDPLLIELHYVFDDNFGGYTIDAIQKSLEEK